MEDYFGEMVIVRKKCVTISVLLESGIDISLIAIVWLFYIIVV